MNGHHAYRRNGEAASVYPTPLARIMKYITLIAVVVLHLSGPVAAQGISTPVKPDVEAIAQKEVDPLGRDTPRGMIFGYLQAMSAGNYETAGRYLDLPNSSESFRKARGTRLAQDLKIVLDRAGALNDNWTISSNPAGSTTDGLGDNIDGIGHILLDGEIIPLLANRVSREPDSQIWLISSETVSKIPELLELSSMSLIDRITPQNLRALGFFGVPASHIVFAVGAGVGLWIFFKFSILALFAATGLLLKSERLKSYIAFAATLRGPVSIICAAATLVPVLEFFGATIVLRGLLAPGIEVFVVICLAVMVLRAADHFIRKAIIKATFSGHVGSASFLTLGRRGVKLAVIFIAILIVMGTMGVNLTAGIAALGIGGLAIALGSQKSIEHFVGSVTVVADRVVRIGDFCRFGTTLGTVEDIGIRSTRIRTLARTLVTVPNGLFSSVEVENFTNRDKFLFRHLVVLRPGTTRAEVSYCLEKILSMLQKEDIVDEEDLRARLISIESATPRIDVFAYIKVTEILEFLEHQERIILKIMAIVEASGTTIAVPSQMIYRADMADLSGGLNMTGQSLHAKSAKTPVQPR